MSKLQKMKKIVPNFVYKPISVDIYQMFNWFEAQFSFKKNHVLLKFGLLLQKFPQIS